MMTISTQFEKTDRLLNLYRLNSDSMEGGLNMDKMLIFDEQEEDLNEKLDDFTNGKLDIGRLEMSYG